MSPAVRHKHLHLIDQAEVSGFSSLLALFLSFPFGKSARYREGLYSCRRRPPPNAITPETHENLVGREPTVFFMDSLICRTVIADTDIGVEPDAPCARKRIISVD